MSTMYSAVLLPLHTAFQTFIFHVHHQKVWSGVSGAGAVVVVIMREEEGTLLGINLMRRRRR